MAWVRYRPAKYSQRTWGAAATPFGGTTRLYGGDARIISRMISWNRVDTVLLDMDGTLLDLHYDNHFWHEHVPQRYAEKHQVTLQAAKGELSARYRRAEGTLDWYCVDYWTRELGLDIPRLKQEIEHMIMLRPHVVEFLGAVRALQKRLLLVTNAHGKALALKLARTRLDQHFDGVVCAHELGLPKEDVGFWDRMQRVQPFKSRSSILIDDSLPVLRSAQRYGIGQLLAVTQPDSQLPARQITEFPAIAYLNEVMP